MVIRESVSGEKGIRGRGEMSLERTKRKGKEGKGRERKGKERKGQGRQADRGQEARMQPFVSVRRPRVECEA